MSKSIQLGVGVNTAPAKRTLAQFANDLRAVSRNYSSIGSELTQGITLPIAAAGIGLLKFAGDLDAMKKALIANMGSVAKANIEFEKLRKLAEAPGIGFEEALKGSIQLQALGGSAEDARYILEGLAKAIELSGGGQAEFGRAMEQMIQMIGRGKLLQEDLKFLFQAAPKMRGVVGEIFGTSNPEELRKITNVKEFVQKTTDALMKLQGTGGSLKNSLENLWTSFKIGAGEVGLALLNVTTWDGAVKKLSSTIDKAVVSVVTWIHEHPKLTKMLAETLAFLAVTGPITRFIANLGLVVSLGAKAITTIYGIAKAMVLLNTEAAKNTWKLGIIGALMYGIGKGSDALLGLDHDTFMGAGKGAARDEIYRNGELSLASKGTFITAAALDVLSGQFGQASDKLSLARGEVFNKQTRGGGLGGISPAAGLKVSEEDKAKKELLSFMNKLNASGDEETKKAKELSTVWHSITADFIKGAVPGVTDMFNIGGIANQAFYETKVKPNDAANEALMSTPLSDLMITTESAKIMTEYEEALQRVRIEAKLGAEAIDLQKMSVEAAAEQYRGMAVAYGESSLEAKEALSVWEKAAEAYKKMADEQKKATEAQEAAAEKLRHQMEMGKALLGGVAEAVSGLVTEGKNGMEAFAKSIMKAVSALVKLAIVKMIEDAIEKFGFIGAIPAILAGGAAIGIIEGVVNSVSLAEGGIVSGETFVRAGEYPGVKANPEVIAPLNKLKGMMNGGDSGMGLEVRLGIDELLVSITKANRRGVRRGSGNVIHL